MDKLVRNDLPLKISRQEREGLDILKGIHKRDPFKGGCAIEVTGMPGSAKTSVILSFINDVLKHQPTERIYFSNSYGTPLQFTKLEPEQYVILVQREAGITFFDRNKDKQVELNVTYFDDFDDLYAKSVPGKCNCVFFGRRQIWMKWIEFLMSKSGWHSIFLDEMSEVTPEENSGQDYKDILHFANRVMGQSRKCNMIIGYNTQRYSEVSWRVRRKLTHKIWMPGSKVDGMTRIQQKAVDNLKRDPVHGNTGIIDYSVIFGYVLFSNIFVPRLNLNIVAYSATEHDEVEVKNNGRTSKRTRKTHTPRHATRTKKVIGLREFEDRKRQRAMAEAQ